MHSKLLTLINELRSTGETRNDSNQVVPYLRADGVQMQGDPRFSGEQLSRRWDVTARNLAQCGEFGREDSEETTNLTRALLHMQSKKVYQVFTKMKATQLVPVDGSIPSGAAAFTTEQFSEVGSAKIVSNFANDFPTVNNANSETVAPLRSIGDSYFYTVQELRAASMAGGQPLSDRRAEVARRVHDRKVERVVAWGDSAAGLSGLLTKSAATSPSSSQVRILSPSNGITGDWDNASRTPAEIYADLMTIAGSVTVYSKDTAEANTLVLPLAAYEIVFKTPYSTFSGDSVGKVFLESNAHVRNIETWAMCDNVDETGAHPISNSNKTRGFVYDRNPSNLDFKIPQQFEQFAPQLVGMQYNIMCHSRIGGVSLYYPQTLIYLDDLTDLPST
jgi:hypothetical protein